MPEIAPTPTRTMLESPAVVEYAGHPVVLDGREPIASSVRRALQEGCMGMLQDPAALAAVIKGHVKGQDAAVEWLCNFTAMAARRSQLIASGKARRSMLQDAADFVHAWSAYADEAGLCEDSISLLFKGFSIAGAAPLHAFIKGDDDGERLKKLEKLRPVRDNAQGATFRLYTHLLCLLMNDGAPSAKIPYLVSRLPQVSVNREGAEYGSIPTAVRKYLLKSLSVEKASACIEGLECGEGIRKRLGRTLSPSFELALANTNTSAKEKDAVRILSEWLLISGKEEKPAEERSGEAGKQTAKDVSFDTVLGDIQVLRAKDAGMQKRLEALKSELAAEQSSSARCRESLEKVRKELNDAVAVKEALEQKTDDLERRCRLLEKDLETAKTEAISQASMVAMLDGDQSRKSDAILGKIASKLRIDYEDYLEALPLEMDKDLGENMRLQLGAVFEILKESGVSL